ncbi:MAG: extracellular solute-binding protein [Clostridiales bacterium]|nr:extracellular solute-binding protein [Clostridiales bacterium]
MKKLLMLVLAVIMAVGGVALAEAAPEETGTLTIYYSHSTEWADPLIQQFEEATGIKCELVQGGTSDLFAKVKAEAENPQADIIWGGVADTYVANSELFQPYVPAEVDKLMPAAIGAGDMWHAFDIEPMVMVYNTDMIAAENAPTKWADMLDEQYKGAIACADPTTSSSSYGVLMGIINAYGTEDGAGYEFVKKLVEALDGKILSSSSGVYKGVAEGEYMIGMTYEEAALRYIAAGEPMAIVYPEEGTYSAPSPVAIVANCKNLLSAQKFVDFVLGQEVQSQLAGLNRRSSRTDIPVAEHMTPMDSIKFVDYDFNWSTSHEKEFKNTWLDYVAELG